jgi:molybdopterin adenylyltransferase
MSRPLSVLIVTVSDRASRGEYEDRSGPAVEAELRRAYPEATVTRRIVADETDALAAALREGLDHDAVLTTGGTGIGPRDITPEVTRAHCERDLPGVAEMLRAESRRETLMAALSRGYAGVRGTTVYVNLPGSVTGARSCTALLVPILEHAIAMLSGGGHEE